MSLSIQSLRSSNTYADLAAVFGVPGKKIASTAYGKISGYQSFLIPKRTGGFRAIASPIGTRRKLQKLLAEFINSQYKPNPNAHGFIVNRSVRSNAEPHVGKRTIVNVDLEDFFGTISFIRVRGMFLASPFSFNWTVANVLASIVCHEGHLPAGGVCSPVISNVLLSKLDKEMSSLAKRLGGVYTRYSDDLTFSFDREPSDIPSIVVRDDAGEWKPGSAIAELVSKHGFSINLAKFRMRTGQARKTVTGLVVNTRANLPWDWIRSLEKQIYASEKFGVDAVGYRLFPNIPPEVSAAKLTRQIHGRLAYLQMIRGRGDWVTSGLAFRFNLLSKAIKLKIPDVEIISQPHRVDRALFVVKGFNGQPTDLGAPDDVGTAFSCEGGWIVSASHVLTRKNGTPYPHIYVNTYLKPLEVIRCDVVVNDTHRDLIILRPRASNHGIFRVRFGVGSTLETGDRLWTVGFPNYMFGDKPHVQEHAVTNVFVASAVHKVDVTGLIHAGLSGGPALDSSQRIVGVVHRGFAAGKGYANHLISVDSLNDVLKTI